MLLKKLFLFHSAIFFCFILFISSASATPIRTDHARFEKKPLSQQYMEKAFTYLEKLRESNKEGLERQWSAAENLPLEELLTSKAFEQLQAELTSQGYPITEGMTAKKYLETLPLPEGVIEKILAGIKTMDTVKTLPIRSQLSDGIMLTRRPLRPHSQPEPAEQPSSLAQAYIYSGIDRCYSAIKTAGSVATDKTMVAAGTLLYFNNNIIGGSCKNIAAAAANSSTIATATAAIATTTAATNGTIESSVVAGWAWDWPLWLKAATVGGAVVVVVAIAVVIYCSCRNNEPKTKQNKRRGEKYTPVNLNNKMRREADNKKGTLEPA